MNTKGTKFLAVLAVLAMAFATLAVIEPADGLEADKSGIHGSDWSMSTMGPLDFGATVTWEPYGTWSNDVLGNSISVTYDATTKTYTVKGTLAYQDPAADGYADGAFKKLWGGDPVTKPYGIAFGVDLSTGDEFYFATVPEEAVTATENYIEPCLKYEGDSTSFDVVVTPYEGAATTYHIDMSGVQLEYTNALANDVTAGTDGADGKWSLEAGVLTLDNYNGKEYFDGTFTKVVLIGENSITLKGVANAIKTTTGLTIGIDSGLASLTINMDDAAVNAAAITATSVAISGIDLNVTMTDAAVNAAAIVTADALDIFNSTQVISVETTASDDATTGFIAGPVSIRASDITVSAGFVGIESTDGDVDIYKSDLVASAKFSALYAVGKVTVAQSSDVLLTTSGIPTIDVEYGLVPYALVAEDGLSNESYSTINATGMKISGESKNFATLTVSGSSMISDTFSNETAGDFTNNGTIGLLGTFTVNTGIFTNNGTLNVLKTVPVLEDWKDYDDAGDIDGVPIALTDPLTGNKVFVSTIYITAAEQKADGTIAVLAVVVFDDNTNEPVLEYLTADGYSGVLTYADDENLWTMSLTATTFNDESKRYTSKINLTAVELSDGKYVYTIISSGSYYDGDGVKSTVGDIKDPTTGQPAIVLFEGDVPEANGSLIVVGGLFDNTGTINIDALTATGVIMPATSKALFTSSGTITSANSLEFNGGVFVTTGSFTMTEGNITIGAAGSFTGDIVLSEKDQVITVVGIIDSVIKFNGTSFENTIDVDGKGAAPGFTVSTAVADKKGHFVVEGLENIDGKTATKITLSKGKMIMNTDSIGTKGMVTALNGTTLQNDKTCEIEGVVAIQDGATFLIFDEDVVETYIYGSIEYTITFADGGFTYYGNLAFALENAPAGMDLTLLGEEIIDSDTAMKNGVKLIFTENAILTIVGDADEPITFTMGDGAEFILADGAVINYQNATVTANVSFGDVMYKLKAVVFGNALYNTTAYASTATKPEKITFDFGETNPGITGGVVELVKGNFDGKIALAAVMESDKVKSFGELDIDANAVSDIVPYFAADNASKAKIVINGIMNSGNIIIGTPITGDGKIVLATGKTATISTVPVSITIGDGTNGFKLAGVTGTALTIKPVATTSTVPAYVLMSGTLVKGTAMSVGNTGAYDLTLEYATSKVGILEVPSGATLSILMNTNATTASLTANGLLKVAGTLNRYTEDTATYGLLVYDIVYTDAGYKVYTKLATAAALAPAGTVFDITEKDVTVDNMTMSYGHTLNIASGKKLIVSNDGVLTVGTAMTSLGAVDVISGTVQLNGTALAIIYSNADVTKAVFKSANDGGAVAGTAIGSAFSLNNVVYCDVYGGTTAKLGDAATPHTAINTVGTPSIDGYIFKGWHIYYPVQEENTLVGESDVYGDLVAKKFLVTINSVDGAVYKQNGSTIVALDSPVYYEYGTIINAVAADGYEGKTLTWTITEDTEITASGFSPVVIEPISGFSITEILLIILVILIAIMAVIVAIRLNRS